MGGRVTNISRQSQLCVIIGVIDYSPSQKDSWRFANFPGVVPSVGIMAFAFMCHHNTFLIYGSIERVTQQKWDMVTHWSLFTSFLIAAAFGIAGYATFTSYVQGDLMENYCWDDDLMNFARVMFSGTILLTFPIECFVTREVASLIFWSSNACICVTRIEGS